MTEEFLSVFRVLTCHEEYCSAGVAEIVEPDLGQLRPLQRWLEAAASFENLLHVLVPDCACWRISDKGCSASTLRRRLDEWIELGAMDALEGLVRQANYRIVELTNSWHNAHKKLV